MHLIKLLLPVFLVFSLHDEIIAQDTATTNLMNQLEKEAGKNKTTYATSTFRYTRVINGHSVENLPAHVLDVRISHRFGPLNSGAYQFFGLDYSPFNVRLGFDYGITNTFMVGIGHNAWQKTYDGFFKVKLLKQSTGAVKIPVTISFVPSIAINTLKPEEFPITHDSGVAINRVSYALQLLIARKFSDGFSLQLMPTFIHVDTISFNHIKSNVFAIGIAGTQRLSKRTSINAEYYYQLPDGKAPGAHDVFSLGIDIGTGGHVFQLHFTNSIGLTEKSFITETTDQWSKGGVRFGFNISRVFQLGKKQSGNKNSEKK